MLSYCLESAVKSHMELGIWRAFTLPRTEFQRMNVHNSVPCKELRYVHAQASAQNRSIRSQQYIILCTVQTTAHRI
jgi:hypothetical protein